MAENANAFNQAATTVVFNDMSDVLLYTAGVLVAGSHSPEIVRPRVYEEIYVTASGGRDLYASVDGGLDEGGLELSMKFIGIDFNNTTDATLVELLRGLHDNNPTAKTGYAARNFTNPLTGGGKTSAKAVVTKRDNEGGSDVTTYVFSVKTVKVVVDGEHFAIDVTMSVIQAISVS